MPTPHALLAALDPEQRLVAEALRGPVRVLAGAGTGKTRAITHRIAHGVATGVYAPTEVLAVTFTTRAAGEMRTRLRTLGAGGVQARTFHSAALRQLRYFWPQTRGAELPTLIESKIGLVAAAARRHRLNADQTLLRDLASEIEWAKVSNVGPGDYAATRRGPRPRGRRPGRRDGGPGASTSYEEVKREQGRMDMEDVLLLTAGHARRGRPGRGRRSAGSTSGSSSTSSKTSRRCSRHCWTSGSAAATRSAWWATRPRRSTRSPARTRRTSPASPPDYPGTTSIELVRNYRSTPEIDRRGQHAARGEREPVGPLHAERPRARRSAFTPHPDEVAEAERGRRRRSSGCGARGHCRCRRSPSWSGSTPRPRRSRRR